MATIVRRTGKPDALGKSAVTYQAKIRRQGHPPVTQSFPLKSEALRWAVQTEAALREGRYFRANEAARHSVADLIDRYGAELSDPKRKAGRAQHLAWFRQHIGSVRLSELTPAKIAECRDTLARQQTKRGAAMAPATVNRVLATFSHALSVATKEWGWLEDSPMRKVRRLPEPQGRVRFLSDDERARLLTTCMASDNPYLYPVVLLALSTGARQGEILGLTWDRVDLGRGWVRLDHTKNGQRRGLPLTGLALSVMRDLSKVRRIDTSLVFPSLKGTVSNQALRRAWDTVIEQAGISDFRFHDLRHTAASYLLMNGASLGEIASILGHRTMAMVARYSHISDAHVADVVGRMNEKIFGGQGQA